MDCKGLEQFEKTFKSVKHNKAAGHDDIDSNVINKVYDEISYPLFMIFHSSFNESIFPDQRKVAKVCPIFNIDNIEEIGNYRSISVLFIFSKVLEIILYKRHLLLFQRKWDKLFPKQFGFQVNYWTHHEIINLTDDILISFEKGQLILGVFNDLSKSFDTVNHRILIHKLDLYRIKGKCLNWFNSYL